MAAHPDVERAVQDVQQAGRWGSFEATRNYLKLVRDYKVRDSENVALYGSSFLREHKHKLPQEEMWLVYEQVAMAAMDCQATDLAYSLLCTVRAHFGPSSTRAKRLAAMFLEAGGKPDEAAASYKDMLESQPHCELAHKRLVALRKAAGDLPGAIEALRKHCDVYQVDREAWEELADLYLQAQMYSQAAFCLEELLLHAPQSLPYHLLLADTLYTSASASASGGNGGGGAGSGSTSSSGAGALRTARSYYAAAVQLSGGASARALYGLCACQAQLAAAKGRVASDDEGLAQLAAEMLVQHYAQKNASKLPLVKSLLSAQGFDV